MLKTALFTVVGSVFGYTVSTITNNKGNILGMSDEDMIKAPEGNMVTIPVGEFEKIIDDVRENVRQHIYTR